MLGSNGRRILNTIQTGMVFIKKYKKLIQFLAKIMILILYHTYKVLDSL